MEVAAKSQTAKGPNGMFSGEVWLDPITCGLPASRLNVVAVRFTRALVAPVTPTTAARPSLSPREGASARSTATTPSHCTQATSSMLRREEHWHGVTPEDFPTRLSVSGGAPRWGGPSGHAGPGR